MKVVQQAGGREKLYIAVIILLLAASAYLFLKGQPAVPKAADNVKEIYSLLTEREVVIMAVKEESGLYVVTVKYPDARGQQVVQDVYLTRDGELIANPLFPNALVKVNETKKALTDQKDFVNCLTGKNFAVFGTGNDIFSLQQLLGIYAGKIYIDCSQNAQLCQQAGVTQTPVTRYNNTDYRGLPLAREAAELTGCTLPS